MMIQRHPSPVLPIELHAPILQLVILQDQRQTWLACALTCRAWFEVMAPTLLGTIYMRSLDRILKFTSRKEDSAPLLSTYVRTLDVQVSPDTKSSLGPVPMLHLIAPYFPHLRQIRSRKSEIELWEVPCHMLAAYKGYYRHFAPLVQLSDLTIANYQFHSFSDILRICGSLHSLEHLHMEHVYWKHTPGSLALLVSHRTFTHKLQHVTFIYCTAPWPFLWLWACAFGSHYHRPLLSMHCLEIVVLVSDTSCRSTSGRPAVNER